VSFSSGWEAYQYALDYVLPGRSPPYPSTGD